MTTYDYYLYIVMTAQLAHVQNYKILFVYTAYKFKPKAH